MYELGISTYWLAVFEYFSSLPTLAGTWVYTRTQINSLSLLISTDYTCRCNACHCVSSTVRPLQRECSKGAVLNIYFNAYIYFLPQILYTRCGGWQNSLHITTYNGPGPQSCVRAGVYPYYYASVHMHAQTRCTVVYCVCLSVTSISAPQVKFMNQVLVYRYIYIYIYISAMCSYKLSWIYYNNTAMCIHYLGYIIIILLCVYIILDI